MTLEQPGQPDQPGAESDGYRLAPNVVLPMSAVEFTYSRSSGPGGQNVNKRSTRVQLRVRLADIPIPSDARRRLGINAGSLRTTDGELLIAADETRSQRRNQQACLDRLGEMVREALVRPKVRRKTKPSKGAIERRLAAKKQRGETKRRRQSPDDHA